MKFTFEPSMVVRTRPLDGPTHFVRNTPSLIITMDNGHVIQVHEKDGYWEVWHIENDTTDKAHCIANSANPPDRHYDE